VEHTKIPEKKSMNLNFSNFFGEPPQTAAKPPETTFNRGCETMGQQLT
jgi:hypothetical protein